MAITTNEIKKGLKYNLKLQKVKLVGLIIPLVWGFGALSNSNHVLADEVDKVEVKVEYKLDNATEQRFGYSSQLMIPITEEPTFPKTKSEYEIIIANMMATQQYNYTFKYDAEMFDQLENGNLAEIIASAFSSVFDKYPEYFCYKNHISLSLKGTKLTGNITLMIDSVYFTEEESETLHNAFFNDAQQVVYDLVKDGKLTEGMSQTEIAKTFYEWVILNLEYDNNFADESYTGYGALKNNTAVCQGYTALFNTLCKLTGIEVWGVSGTVKDTDHIWSEAILDGNKVIIDTTFGDPTPNKKDFVDYKYFMISENELRKTHNW